MTVATPLRSAWLLDGNGGGQALDWSGVQSWQPADGVLWAHFDRASEDAESWLTSEAGLSPAVVQALFAVDTRPRVDVSGGGALIVLRAVNLDPEARPEDMVSLRLWVEKARIVSVRVHRVQAAVFLRNELAGGTGPTGAGDFLAQLTALIVDNIAPLIAALDEQMGTIEDDLGTAAAAERELLADIRRQAARLRRYIGPQSDVLWQVSEERIDWISGEQRMALRSVADRIKRHAESLDAIREQAIVAAEQLVAQQTESLARNTYILSVIAAILLPLNFAAGMLGMNVGGIPLAKSAWGFWLVAAGFALAGAFIALLLRWRKWF